MTDVDSAKELPTVLSFCSGYAGAERGLDLAGFKHRVIAYVEIEAYAIANLANKMEAGELLPAPIWSNLKTLPVQPFRDKVSLLTSGYPCQPFSAAGERKGTDDPRHLWPYIRRHIESIRPVRCFFENVEGHISLGLREVISDLESLGYVCAWGIFSAREVGAPHQRKRVYILADTISARSEIGLSGQKRSNKEGNAGITDNCDSEQGGWQIGMHWPPEPGVGRVVDGCPDRVDRIRMLGNGIVPQTAAKAWITLNKRIEALND
jgi:DNA (cytosine-5)-methyltransferase 1